MAVPKRKVSKARRDKRRSAVWKLSAPALSRCPNCGEKLEFDLEDLSQADGMDGDDEV